MMTHTLTTPVVYRLTIEWGSKTRPVDVVDYGGTDEDIQDALARAEGPGIWTSILWTLDRDRLPYGMPVKVKGSKVYGATATKRDRDRLSAHIQDLADHA